MKFGQLSAKTQRIWLRFTMWNCDSLLLWGAGVRFGKFRSGGGLAQPPPRGLPRATALKKGGCLCFIRIDLSTCMYVVCYSVSLSCLVLVCYVFREL